MALDITKLPRSMLDDLHARGLTDDRIAFSTVEEAFREWCEWNGFIKWSDTILRMIRALDGANVSVMRIDMDGDNE